MCTHIDAYALCNSVREEVMKDMLKKGKEAAATMENRFKAILEAEGVCEHSFIKLHKVTITDAMSFYSLENVSLDCSG